MTKRRPRDGRLEGPDEDGADLGWDEGDEVDLVDPRPSRRPSRLRSILAPTPTTPDGLARPSYMPDDEQRIVYLVCAVAPFGALLGMLARGFGGGLVIAVTAAVAALSLVTAAIARLRHRLLTMVALMLIGFVGSNWLGILFLGPFYALAFWIAMFKMNKASREVGEARRAARKAQAASGRPAAAARTAGGRKAAAAPPAGPTASKRYTPPKKTKSKSSGRAAAKR